MSIVCKIAIHRREPKRAERKDSERSDGGKYSDRYRDEPRDRYKDEPRDRYKDDQRGGSRSNRDGKYGRDGGDDR